MKTEFRRLPVKLTPGELQARGKTLADEIESYKRTEGAKKASAEDFGGRLKNTRARIDDLSRVVASGEERRDVECHFVRFEESFEIAWVREDTGEQVERRPMTVDERQVPLRLVGHGFKDDTDEKH